MSAANGQKQQKASVKWAKSRERQSLEMHWSLLQGTLLSARDSMSLDSAYLCLCLSFYLICRGIITTIKISQQSLRYFWYSDSSLDLSSKDKDTDTSSQCLKEPCGIKNSLRTQLIDWCLLARVEGMYTRKHYSNALKGLSTDLVLWSEIHVREVFQVMFSCLLKMINCIQMSHFVP